MQWFIACSGEHWPEVRELATPAARLGPRGGAPEQADRRAVVVKRELRAVATAACENRVSKRISGPFRPPVAHRPLLKTLSAAIARAMVDPRC